MCRGLTTLSKIVPSRRGRQRHRSCRKPVKREVARKAKEHADVKDRGSCFLDGNLGPLYRYFCSPMYICTYHNNQDQSL
jgi:hypothetical protein